MSVLTPNQEKFASVLAQKTGLDHNVIRAWVLAEESYTAAQQRDQSGNQNWLNYSAGTGPGGRFDHPEWNGDPAKAANAIANVIASSSYYTGIKASAGKHPAAQIEAIATSPWDAGHYNGGSGLMSTYHLVSGLPVPNVDTTPTAPTAPKTPKAIDGAATDTIGLVNTDPLPSIPAAYLKGSNLALPGTGTQGMALPPLHMSGGVPLPALPVIKMPTLLPPVPDPAKAVTAAKPAGTIAATIVASARSQIGVPYKWGAEKKGVAFDCSGLIQWAAAQHGLSIPRVTTDQVHIGTAVASTKLLQPGDLLFFGADHHHVAIYSGNGKMIEAPHRDTVVREVPLRTGDLTAMRRLPTGKK